MKKSKSVFICQQCGYQSPSFLGRCPNCNSWNSLVETLRKSSGLAISSRIKGSIVTEPVALSTIKTAQFERIRTGINEFDQVVGGGIVPGSVILLSGDPGIGKSTLMLQIIALQGGLYVSGEESAQQVKLRAERLKLVTDRIFIFPETNIEAVIEAAKAQAQKNQIIIVDSIQTVWSEKLTGPPGSVGQVREGALSLLEFAKKEHVPVILIGHITKEGTLAGPKVLEHIVDTVLYLEGERYQTLRLLRATKNRFGPVDEVGVFSMEEKGLTSVGNPSELFLDTSASGNPAGRVTIATLEGSRPLLVEIQALTVASNLAQPRRVATGVNPNRIQMLVAILQKHLRLPLGNFDVFVNAASGIKVIEPAADLGICLAILSSFKNIPLLPKTVAIGEVGLLGEIRNVVGMERRTKEVKRLGFSIIVSPTSHTTLNEVAKSIF